MLRVLLDEYGIVSQQGRVITSYDEYAAAWSELIASIGSQETSTVVLRSPFLESYFRNLKDKFGSRLEIQRVLPSIQWEKAMGFRLPQEVGEQQIARLLASPAIGMLKENKNRELGTLCNLLGIKNYSDYHTEDLLMECILKGAAQRFPKLTIDCVEKVAAELPPGKRGMWRRIREERDPREFLLNLMKSFIAQHYPPDSAVFQEYYKESLTFSTFEFPARLSDYLDNEFRLKVKTSLEHLTSSKVLTSISGKLDEEWDWVLHVLTDEPFQDEATISSLLKKAIEYPKQYYEIKQYEPVSPPPDAINDAEIDEWIKQYFDFYLYSRRIGRPEATEHYASVFEDFILRHFQTLDEFYSERSILRVRLEIERQLKARRRVLLLVVDGLSYSYHHELRKIFEGVGSFMFATLPTVTAINKQRILSGLVDLDESYDVITDRLYNQYRWKKTDSDSQELAEFLKEKFDLYIYWENQFDNLIHRPMTFEKRFRDHVSILQRLSESIATFLADGGIVILVGDHGFTALPRQPQYKVDCEIPKSTITHSRVVYAEEGLNSILPSHATLIGGNTAIARGYHYFNNSPKGATHGGATPEEMTVPFFIVESRQEEPAPLIFALDEKKYLRKRKHDIRLIINNPNNDLRLTDIKFAPQLLKLYIPFPILLVRGMNSLSAELDLREVKTSECKVFIEYQINGRPYHTSLDITTGGAMTEPEDEWE